jgi:DNA-binding NtrC family response regulator
METALALKEKTKTLLLIDDDPIFCNLMSGAAKALGLELEYYNSVLEMDQSTLSRSFDMGILDYDLGPINGFDIAQHAPQLLQDRPVILVSAYEKNKLPTIHWPRQICGYICKKDGAFNIVNYAKSMMKRHH